MDINQFNPDSTGKPLCRFGPGGEFISDWPARDMQSPPGFGNRLGKVLTTIADMIGATMNPELLNEIEHSSITEASVYEQKEKEKNQNANNKTAGTGYAPPVSGAENNSKTICQAMLFSDDGGVSSRVGHKPNNRIRTRRRTSKKKTDYRLKGQGTLFEAHGAGQSAA